MTLKDFSKDLKSIELLGIGKVGCSFLNLLDKEHFKVIKVTDSKNSLFSSSGLNILEILKLKEFRKKDLTYYPRKEEYFNFLASEINSKTIVDVTNTNLSQGKEKFKLYEQILKEQNKLIICARDGLFYGADILMTEFPNRIGIQAALNGIGSYLQENLQFLRNNCTSFESINHPASTFLIECMENGYTLKEAVCKGISEQRFEYTAQEELSGKNAFISTSIVAKAIFGYPQDHPILLENLENLDPDLLRYRKSRGNTTRLLCSANANGTISITFKEISIASPLCASANNVSYQFNLKNQQSNIIYGVGVGIRQTTIAILDDLFRLSQKQA